MKRKIIITGATGLIGTKLCKALNENDYEITIFTRSVEKAKSTLGASVNPVKWDYRNPAEWEQYLEDTNAIIHLAGANLSEKRWTKSYKKIIYDSRIISTKNLVSAIGKCKNKIKTFISSSAVGYYGSRGEELLTEESNAGNNFLAKVCADWEMEAQKAAKFGVRTTMLRQGVVLSTEDGALKKLLLPFKLFVGGPLAGNKQWFPWIHVDDLINIYLFVLNNSNIFGPVNAVSQDRVRMKEFAKTLGNTLNRPSLFKVPEFALRILVGEVTSSLSASQNIIPKKLLEQNFKFEFEKLDESFRDLLKAR